MNKVPTDLRLDGARMYTAKCKATMVGRLVLTCSWVGGSFFLVSRFKRGGVEKMNDSIYDQH